MRNSMSDTLTGFSNIWIFFKNIMKLWTNEVKEFWFFLFPKVNAMTDLWTAFWNLDPNQDNFLWKSYNFYKYWLLLMIFIFILFLII